MLRRHARAIAVVSAAAILAIVALVLIGTGGSGSDCYSCGVRSAAEEPPVAAAPEASRLFAPDSVWNAPLAPDAPLEPDAEDLVAKFVADIHDQEEAGTGPWIQTHEYSTPLYVVGPDQPTTSVTVDDRPDAASWEGLQRAFAEVPMPKGARPAAGTDAHMTIYQPSTDSLWEFWRLYRAADGWHARWGGAMRGVSTNPGYYTADAHPGATPLWGSTASSLPIIGGTILISELQAGRIDHALALNIPYARPGVFSWPAQRTDGAGDKFDLPEGARLRIDPDFDLDAVRMAPAGRVIAEAAQKYGMIVRDQTGTATGFYAEDPTRYRTNPYPELFGNRLPSEILATFPWDEVELMEMHLCTREGVPCEPR